MDLATQSDEQLEQLLLDATQAGVPGRMALARVTAIRTILARRARRLTDVVDASRALELVNAVRGPGDQLAEVHPTWVASIVADPGWAEVYVSDDEMTRTRGGADERP